MKGNKSLACSRCVTHMHDCLFRPPLPHGECNLKSILHVLRCTSAAQVALPQRWPPRSIRPRQHQKHLNHFSGRDWSQMERKGRREKEIQRRLCLIEYQPGVYGPFCSAVSAWEIRTITLLYSIVHYLQGPPPDLLEMNWMASRGCLGLGCLRPKEQASIRHNGTADVLRCSWPVLQIAPLTSTSHSPSAHVEKSLQL